jgi:perosamine synthetase
MKIQRTIPPAAAPIGLKSLLYGVAGFFFGKKYMKRLDDELKGYFGVKHVFLVSSGKAALTLILQALKFLSPYKREVLIPAYTCFSVPSAIVKAGLKVSLCDIDSTTFDFDYKLLAETINKNTLCVIPTHLFGIPSDMDRINNLCRDRGIFVIEDAAQAMGEKYNGTFLGTLGDVGFLSLGRGKNITCGSGSIIVTNDETIAGVIAALFERLNTPSFGETLWDFINVLLLGTFLRPSLFWFPTSLSFLKLGETIFDSGFPTKKMSGMKAGLLTNWQSRLEKSNRARASNTDSLRTGLAATSAYDKQVSFPIRLPFLTRNRKIQQAVVNDPSAKVLGISRMYPAPINEIDELKGQFPKLGFPAAKERSERLVTIPTHELLASRDRELICAYFRKTIVRQ